jgi:arsenite methyltransferase
VNLRRRLNAGLARQLGHPAGLAGRVVGRALNRGNRRVVSAAVDALAVPPGAAVADIGFGGGVGLELLLERVGDDGRVHGVDISAEMLDRASRRFRDAIAAGRLTLHHGSMTDPPFAAGQLDGIISTNTIYFVADLDGAFAALAAALKPSGRIVLGMGDPEAMRAMPFTPYGFTLRPVDDVVASLVRAGLALEEDRRVGHGQLPFHLLVAAVR